MITSIGPTHCPGASKGVTECNNSEISFWGPRGQIVIELITLSLRKRPILERPCFVRIVVYCLNLRVFSETVCNNELSR